MTKDQQAASTTGRELPITRGRVIRDRVTLAARSHGLGRIILTANGVDRTGVFVGLLDFVSASAPWAQLDEVGGGRVGEFFHAMLVLSHPDLWRADTEEVGNRVASEVDAFTSMVVETSAVAFPGRVTAAVDAAQIIVTGPGNVTFARYVFAALAELDVAVRQAEWETQPTPGGRAGTLTVEIGLPAALEDPKAALATAFAGRPGVALHFDWA